MCINLKPSNTTQKKKAKNKKNVSIRSLTYMNTSKYANNIRLMDHKSTFYLLIYSVMILI